MLRVAEGLDKRAHISNLSRATTRDYTCPPDRIPLLWTIWLLTRSKALWLTQKHEGYPLGRTLVMRGC